MSKKYVKKLLALNFGFNVIAIKISLLILYREEIQSVHFTVKGISYTLKKDCDHYLLTAWDPWCMTWNCILVIKSLNEVKHGKD